MALDEQLLLGAEERSVLTHEQGSPDNPFWVVSATPDVIDGHNGIFKKDVEAAVALYAPGTVLESPLVRHLLTSERGIVEGRDKLLEDDAYRR